MKRNFEGQITFIYTTDLERSAVFYGDLIGLEQVLDQDCCRIFRIRPGAYLGVCRMPERPLGTAGITISFITDEVDDWHRRLSAAGIECLQAPEYSERFRVYSTFFLDPDGYRVEFQEFRNSPWQG